MAVPDVRSGTIMNTQGLVRSTKSLSKAPQVNHFDQSVKIYTEYMEAEVGVLMTS